MQTRGAREVQREDLPRNEGVGNFVFAFANHQLAPRRRAHKYGTTRQCLSHWKTKAWCNTLMLFGDDCFWFCKCVIQHESREHNTSQWISSFVLQCYFYVVVKQVYLSWAGARVGWSADTPCQILPFLQFAIFHYAGASPSVGHTSAFEEKTCKAG